MEKAKTLKMAIIEPFEWHYTEYENWFEKNSFAYQSELAAIKEFIPDHRRGIEIGLGSGRFATPLGIEIGIDPSPKMREIAKSYGLEVYGAVAQALPFTDGCFDFALMVTTICFLDDVEAALKEAYRIIKPSGSLIIGFIDKDSPIGKLYQQHKKKSVFYSVATFYSVNEIVSQLEKVGFNHFNFVQTIFHNLTEISDVEPIKAGYGGGSFVVVRAIKMKNEGMQSCVNQNSEVNRLERALSSFLSPPKVASLLAQVLVQACKAGKVSYDEIEEMLRDDPEDALLLGFEWRLLLPTRSARGSLEWGDAVLLLKPGEMYKMPNVAKYLVEEAIETGRWDPENAVAEIFKVMGESEWKKMAKLVQKLGEESKDYKINAIQIKRICRELDLEDKVDLFIAELKGSGVMSPKVSSLTEAIREGSPIYELNPSLFVNRTGR